MCPSGKPRCHPVHGRAREAPVVRGGALPEGDLVRVRGKGRGSGRGRGRVGVGVGVGVGARVRVRVGAG